MPAIQIRDYPVRVYPPLAGGHPPVVPPDPEPDAEPPTNYGKLLLVIIGTSVLGALVLWLIRTAPRPVEWVNVGCGVVAFVVVAAAFTIIRRAYARA